MPSDLPPLPSLGLPPLPGDGEAPATATPLTQKQKAAVIVRLLLGEGARLPLDHLPEDMQAELTAEMGGLRRVDRGTLRAVVEEFAQEVDSIGLHFPGGVAGALGLMEDHISPATAARLRREAGVAARGDPWRRIAGLSSDRLAQVLEQESTEVGAVLLAKMDTKRAAELLSMLPGDRARALSFAISKTGRVDPETVQRIGVSLASQLDTEPVRAFPDGPVRMVGEILNTARSATRDEVLAGLEEQDAEFAAEVRRAIFTFTNLPERIDPRDISRIVREVDPEVLRTALAYAGQVPGLEASRDFVLDNMSKRMADALREEMEEADAPTEEAGEEALTAMIGRIREMIDAGEVLMLAGT